LKVFENMDLRRIFGTKSDEVTEECRELHSEELHILYSSQNIIRQISQGDLGGLDTCHTWERKVYKV
jgi:hypothetical protein